MNEFCRGISMETQELLTIEQFTVWEPILPSLVKVMRATVRLSSIATSMLFLGLHKSA